MLTRSAICLLRSCRATAIGSTQLASVLESTISHQPGNVLNQEVRVQPFPSTVQIYGFAKEAKTKMKAKAVTTEQSAFPSSEVIDELKNALDKAVEYLQHELQGVRTGRAHPGLLEPLHVTAHGEHMPLKACGAVIVRNNQTLAVTVYDPALVDAVVAAIQASPLDLKANVEAGEIIVPVPRISREVLTKMSKLVKQEAEDAKISVRHARQKALDAAKKANLPTDERKRFEKEVQKLHDDYVKNVDVMRAGKEKELQEHH